MPDLASDPAFHRYLIAAAFVSAGVLHFLMPELFMRIMPDYIPWQRQLVYLSGIAEIAGGLGILIFEIRQVASYGLIVLLLAVFPANIDMAVKAIRKKGWLSYYSVLLLLRLPLQFLLIYWVYWAGLVN